MRRRWAVAASVAALPVVLAGCAGVGACSAVAYLYDGPAVVSFSPRPPADLAVSACFGDGCGVAPVVGVGGEWRVEQRPPFQSLDVMPGSIAELRILAASGDVTLVDRIVEIPLDEERTGVSGRCPGPFSFEPVVVAWDGS